MSLLARLGRVQRLLAEGDLPHWVASTLELHRAASSAEGLSLTGYTPGERQQAKQ